MDERGEKLSFFVLTMWQKHKDKDIIEKLLTQTDISLKYQQSQRLIWECLAKIWPIWWFTRLFKLAVSMWEFVLDGCLCHVSVC